MGTKIEGIGEEKLYKMYRIDDMSQRDIANYYDVSEGTIYNRLKEFGFVYSMSEARKKRWAKVFHHFRVERICKQCGNGFFSLLSEVETGRGLFCSMKCRREWEQNRKIKRICQYCSKPFYVHLSRFEGGRGKFCSKECYSKWQSENKRGESNPSWKGGKVKRKCPICGEEFEIYPTFVKEMNCCSLKCARRVKKFPKHHTKPELIFEEICKKYNLPFRYVGDSELWIGKRGEKQLNPDFVECNGKKIIVEIMGDYWHSPLLNPKLMENNTLHYRKNFYKRYGWKSVFIWESDLTNREDTEAFVLSQLRKEVG